MMNLKKIAQQILRGLKFITIEQWQRIDEDYKTHDDFDLKTFSVFIAAAAVLIISKYFCKTDFIVAHRELYKTFLCQENKE